MRTLNYGWIGVNEAIFNDTNKRKEIEVALKDVWTAVKKWNGEQTKFQLKDVVYLFGKSAFFEAWRGEPLDAPLYEPIMVDVDGECVLYDFVKRESIEI